MVFLILLHKTEAIFSIFGPKCSTLAQYDHKKRSSRKSGSVNIRLKLKLQWSPVEVIKRCRQIAFASIGQDYDYCLPCVFGLLGKLDGCKDCRAR